MSAMHSNVQLSNSSLYDIAGNFNILNQAFHHHDNRSETLFPSTLPSLVARGAAYDAAERRPHPRCHPGTRITTLTAIDHWVDTDVTRVCWLHGPAGSGKSAIAQTVCEKYAEKGLLAASFFFARSSATRNAMQYLFPTILAQMIVSLPGMRGKLQEKIKEDPFIANRDGGAVRLLVEMFGSSETPIFPSHLVVIDGLDECTGNDDQRLILNYIHELIHIHRLPLRFLVVSRPEPQIRQAFEHTGTMAITATCISLYEARGAHEDVFKFLESEFLRIYNSDKHADTMRFVPKPWPPPRVLHQLAEKSGGYFIYASTVVKYIDEEYFSPLDRLEEVMGIGRAVHGTGELSPFAELDKLYVQIFSSCRRPALLKQILGFAFIGVRPTIAGIEKILFLRPGEVLLVCRGLQSIVRLYSEYPYFSFDLVHASLRDFLLDETRSGMYYLNMEHWEDDILRAVLYSQSRHNLVGESRGGRFSVVLRVVGRWFFTPNIQKLGRLLNIVRNSIKNDPWKSYMLAIQHRQEESRWDTIQIWTSIIERSVKNNMGDHGYQDIINEVDALCDLFLHTYFSALASSPMEIQYVQGLSTLPVRLRSMTFFDDYQIPQLLHAVSICEPWKKRLGQLYWSYHPSELGGDDPEDPYHKSWLRVQFHEDCLRILCEKTTSNAFERFMHNPGRSREFYASPQVCHGRIAEICLRELVLAAESSRKPGDYERTYWVFHLLQSKPGDEGIRAQLKRLQQLGQTSRYLGSIRSERVLSLVNWLMRADKPSVELSKAWEAMVMELLSDDNGESTFNGKWP